MTNYLAEAKTHRHMAEEYRMMADVAAHDGLQLADDEERAANNFSRVTPEN
jgi:hypothetical protein